MFIFGFVCLVRGNQTIARKIDEDVRDGDDDDDHIKVHSDNQILKGPENERDQHDLRDKDTKVKGEGTHLFGGDGQGARDTGKVGPKRKM